MTHLDNAKRLLAIAESGDAKKEAYKAAAEEIAAHKAETGDTNGNVATFLGVSIDRVQKLLQWRSTGYQADSPYLMDDGATMRARVSHTKRALADPVERTQVFATMEPEVKAAVVEAAVNDPEVVKQVMAKPFLRKRFEDEEERAAKERYRQAREQQGRAKVTSLSEFFWNVIQQLDKWSRDLAFARDELTQLPEGQKPEVRAQLVRLRDQTQASIDVLDGIVGDDVIEGHETNVRELHA